MPTTPDRPLDDPRIQPFLPMLYVAWADGDLEAGEIRDLCHRVSSVSGLEDGCRQLLGRWLDPDDPPSPRQLHLLLERVREAAESLPEERRRTLSDFGVELARRDGGEPGAAERRALEEVEEALGLGTADVAGRFRERPRPAPPSRSEPAFDPAAMTRYLDGGHHALRAELRSLLGEERFHPPLERQRGEYRDWVLERCRDLAERGYGAVGFPERYGGRDDLGAMIAVAEILGFGDLSVFVKFGVQFGLFGGSILQLGTDRHHRLLADVGTLELPGCFAMSESGHGSNVAELETVAVYDPEAEEFEVHTPHPGARKDYIGNAARHGRMATVFAQLEVSGERHGVHAFLVPIRGDDGEPLPGVGIGDCGPKMGLDGVDNGRLTFDRVRIPRENLLDRFGRVGADGGYESPIASPTRRFFTMLGTLVGGRITVAQVGLSAAKVALAIAVRYGDRRRQFGPQGEPETRLLDYRTHQRRLLPRLARSYALDFALEQLAERYLAAPVDDRRDVEALAAGLKALATWHATDTIQTCREACGGNGYLAVNRFADLKADSDVFTTFEGDNTVLLQLLAKSLLTGYKKQFHDMGVFGMLRYVAGRAAEVVGEWNPLNPGYDEDELRDRELQLKLLRWRSDHLLAAVARRLKKRLDGGVEPAEAIHQVQDHLVNTAKAHVERVVAERFAEAVERAERGLQQVLAPLADLHLLSRIEADRGFFLAHGAFDAATGKRVRKVVNRLCGELRPQAVHLADAFGIPDDVLRAPIAVDPEEASLWV